ncbi:TPA: hypothetical protein ONB59_001829 [Pseudomonas aeruginosa]|nr:hypothetical protein [Pseudomonas aeruginosa]
MTKANECTCPSGDGSLRHPCPAHPASVELAGVGAKLTFINGRPAMCGCQVEYSSGGGEYSDVIDVTLCAKHSGSAILDLVATNRIALTPEYEGQWHADLYLDREIPLAKAEGATPAEAVLALMSAERIDPEQGGVDQAGGDRWDALQSIMEWTAAENIPDDRKLCLIRNAARAALAQPSPKCEFCGGTGEISGVEGEDDWVNGPCPRCAYPAQAEQAEAERPEVVAVMESNGAGGKRLAQRFPIVNVFVGDELMTVAQHGRIVEARWNRAMDLMGEHVARISEKFKAERDDALARVAELEAKLSDPTAVHQWQFSNAWFDGSEEVVLKAGKEGSPIRTLYTAPPAQAQQLHDLDKQCRDDVARALGLRPSQERGFAWSYLLASIKSCVKASEDAAQAQHSVPEGYALIPVRETEAMHDAVMALLYKGVARTDTQKLLDAYIAAAPGKEG